MLGNPVRQTGVAELRPRAKGERLGELEDLDEDLARPIDVDWGLARRQRQIKPAGRSKTSQSIGAGLALAAHIGVDHGARHSGSPGELGLAEPAGGKYLAHNRHVIMLAEALTGA